MKKRILCLSLVFVSLISIVFSSFFVVYADDFDINDYIEVHRPEIPKVDNNGDLLQDDIDTSFDDEFYNSPDEIDEDEKDEKTFDEKQSYSSDSSSVYDSNNNSNSSTERRKSITRSCASSINEDSESGISVQSDDTEDDTLNIGLLENWLTSSGSYPFVITKDNVLQCFQLGFYKYWSAFIKDNSNYNDNNYDSYYLLENYPDLFKNKNLIILKYDSYYLKAKGYSDCCYVYEFIFCEDDYYLKGGSTVDTDSTKGNFFEARVCVI